MILSNPVITGNLIYRWLYEKRIHSSIRESTQPKVIRIENTSFCNSSCTFCPHSEMQRKQGVMSDELYESIIPQIREFGIGHLIIHGFGEPLLDRHFEKKVTSAKKAGIRKVTTNSNGFLLTEDRSMLIIDSGLDEIYISFDAATESVFRKIRPGLDFKTIENNIIIFQNLKKRKLSHSPLLYLSFVKCPDNAHEVNSYLDKWNSIADGISISEIHNWGDGFKSSDSEKVLRDPCRILWNELNITWDGQVSLCCNDYDGKVIIGDCSEESIIDIWNGEKLRRLRELHMQRDFSSITICSACTYNTHVKSPWWF